jgi:xanthine/uracil permease
VSCHPTRPRWPVRLALVSLLVFGVLAVLEALVAPNPVLRGVVYGAWGPASLAIAAAVSVDLPRRSPLVTTLLLVAGIGSVFREAA